MPTPVSSNNSTDTESLLPWWYPVCCDAAPTPAEQPADWLEAPALPS